MEEYTWFEQTLGGHWADRQRINEAARELTALRARETDAHGEIERLFQLDCDQGREIARLQLVLNTLIDLILKHQLLPEAELVQGLSTALEALEQGEQREREARRLEQQKFDPFCIAPKGG